jgi:small subunit ribosomal protein S7e
MSIARKIIKPADAEPITETETQIAQALLDLEKNVPELRKDLSPLQFSAAKEVSMHSGASGA